ncbi:hypothetical protein LCGC14_0548030 [marine sediment metagenome]|uniref:Uncharacterized protein n=1 Tax=marine sediment metagenome TaxID=412755 RepID=A0A0F9UCB5_9ZZZZ
MKLKELKKQMGIWTLMGNSLEAFQDEEEDSDEYPTFYAISKKEFDKLIAKEHEE